MEDWQGWQGDWYYPSHKDLDDSIYFHCLCQFCNIMLSPLLVASLTLRSGHDSAEQKLEKAEKITEWHQYQDSLIRKGRTTLQ